MRRARNTAVGACLCALVVALVAWLSAPSLAHAEDKPRKPELVDELDMMRLELATARYQIAVRAAEDAKREWEEATTAIRRKHKLADNDEVNPKTREILRRPQKPEAPPAKAGAKN